MPIYMTTNLQNDIGIVPMYIDRDDIGIMPIYGTIYIDHYGACFPMQRIIHFLTTHNPETNVYVFAYRMSIQSMRARGCVREPHHHQDSQLPLHILVLRLFC